MSRHASSEEISVHPDDGRACYNLAMAVSDEDEGLAVREIDESRDRERSPPSTSPKDSSTTVGSDGGKTMSEDNGRTDKTLMDGSDKSPAGKAAREDGSSLRYILTQVPPVPVLVSCALQHVLVSLSGALTMAAVISDSLCADQGHPIRARLFATTLAMQGISTITQTLLGVRLPVFQGPSSSFLVPLLAISTLPGWTCPDAKSASQTAADGYTASNASLLENTTAADYLASSDSLTMDEKLKQLSGSLILASLLEVVVGGLGLVQRLLRYIGPLTVGTTIMLIGIPLFRLPVLYAKFNPAVALGSTVLIVVFSLYMSKIRLPLCACGKGRKRTYLPIFQLFPFNNVQFNNYGHIETYLPEGQILMAVLVMWLVCGVLTAFDAVPDDPDHPYYLSRTDAKMDIVHYSPWIQPTYPGQFGTPSFNLAATIGFLAAFMASMVESVGDYYATARCCRVMPPPSHAVCRGILVEGLASCLSGAVGVAHATTSFSVNIALISLTKTASRSVLVVAGFILLILSLFGKVGALVATMPSPILSGILLTTLGLLATTGMSTLSLLDLSSSRNLLIIGTSLMTGLVVPDFVRNHGDMLATGNTVADQVVVTVLGSPMFLGMLLAVFLDSTVPGTAEERGIVQWNMSHVVSAEDKHMYKASAETSTSAEGGVQTLSYKKHSPEEKEKEAEIDLHKGEKDTTTSLTEDDVYGFSILKGRLTGRVWRYVPFMPYHGAQRKLNANANGCEKC